ncbi:MAG: hypothetical protein EBR47_00940 [Betaproteobacteria bacterium]|nr:hypothetical protein [Betaproteobacteria bacterium]
MDNGRYMQYRYENPVVNTFITTYEHVTMFPEQLTNEEIVVISTFIFLALYAMIKLVLKYFFNKKDKQEN